VSVLQPLLLLTDGDAVVHRAYHALAKTPLSLKRTGEPTGAVFGFANMFLRTIAELNPTHCAVTFDRPTPTFRHLQYEDYKAQRPPSPPDLAPQFQRVRQMVEAFSTPIYEIDGYEADDVLGTLSRQASEMNIDAVIFTGDTDTIQLVSPRVRIYLWNPYTGKATLYDEVAVKERYGVEPAQMADLKALRGDPSDNIPGVPGVGDKTAVKLLQEFRGVEDLLENLDRVEPPKLRELLRAHQDLLKRGKVLTTIVTSVPIALDLERCAWGQFHRDKVLDLFRDLEFNSLLGRMPEPKEPSSMAQGQMQLSMEVPSPPAAVPADYHLVASSKELAPLVRELASAEVFAFDVESTSEKPIEARLVGLSFSTRPGEAWYVAVGHSGSEGAFLEEALGLLKPILEDPAIPKVAHNGGYDMSVLANHGIRVQGLAFDTMLAAHLLNEKSIGLKALAFNKLKVEMTHIESLIGRGSKQITMDRVPAQEAYAYACADADMTLRLKGIFEPELKAWGNWELFTQLEMRLVPALVTIERNGVILDIPALKKMSVELGEQMAEIEDKIYEAAGHHFNLNSPQQLSDVLFSELKLPKTKRTKTGYSTDAQAIEELKKRLKENEGYVPEILVHLLEYREISKLKSTYVDALPRLVNPITGRVHTSFNQAGSATGRMSSSDPNLQNIPVRTEMGKRVRDAFVAPDRGWLLLSADYSQIELRILAHISQDSQLLEAFHRGEDIHAATASQVYSVALDQVTPDMRRFAKVINFGVLYGMSEYGLSVRSDLTVNEASPIIKSYFQKYPGINRYLEETKRFARANGYVQTLLGRRRYLPEVRSPNFQVRSAAERMAINMPIQGTAADIIKVAMVNIHQRMEERKLRSRMVLQVHDELIFEVPRGEEGEMRDMVQELMPQMPDPLRLSVPLKVDIKAGFTWGEME